MKCYFFILNLERDRSPGAKHLQPMVGCWGGVITTEILQSMPSTNCLLYVATPMAWGFMKGSYLRWSTVSDVSMLSMYSAGAGHP